MSSQNGSPIRNSRTDTVRVSIWCNEIHQDGESRIRYLIRIPKRRRRGHGSGKGTDRDCPDELPQLAAAMQKAFEEVRTESKDAKHPSAARRQLRARTVLSSSSSSSSRPIVQESRARRQHGRIG